MTYAGNMDLSKIGRQNNSQNRQFTDMFDKQVTLGAMKKPDKISKTDLTWKN